MYAAIRRYEKTRSLNDEARRGLQERFIPRLQELDGFVDYYMVEGSDKTLATVSVFESPEHADRSNEIARQYIGEENLGDVLPTPPMTTMGEVVAHAARAGAVA